MRTSILQRGWLFVLLVAMGAAAPAHAQLSEMDIRLSGGMIFPTGTFGDYYDAGPSVALTVVRPLGDRLGALLDVGFDRLGREQHTYVPYTNLWRLQLGVEAEVVEDFASIFSLRPYVRAGATSFRSEPFTVIGHFPDSREFPRDFTHTYFAGTGGVRLVIEPGDGLTWFLNGEFGWSPVAEEDMEILRKAADVPLDPFSAAVTRTITAGLSFRTR